ncbi:ankyrin repeat domain-containing protein SOWAHB-like [Myxocyprinus asiaticus]|uniref:ankyrin repeat domain-containing protein SOWAHB-like n=1 Tax=Myxocyprinus asiaticus TaxID=70543 RepID=UPI002223BE90|nr:ankyrin repeat domain-containing protein SOWAHB-like [Myxocyprinus asiaticus]
MDLTQEAILNMLIEGGGKVKNSDILSKYKGALNCSDPAERKQNRELFKTFVNQIAIVKKLQDTKYIVLKKVYLNLLEVSEDKHTPREEDEEDGSNAVEDFQNAHQKTLSRSSSKSSDSTVVGPSPIEVALERSKNVDLTSKMFLHFTFPLKSDPDDLDKHEAVCPAKKEVSTNKPYALPLRMPPVNISHHHNKITSSEHSGSVSFAQEPHSSPQSKWRPSTDSVASAGGSPQVRRHFKTPKQSDEPKYSHQCPLDFLEHQWLVKSAAGQWSQVYGLLLMDVQLAEKKDFMSGFTALHWAVKCGNFEMVCRIVDLSRKSDRVVDVNAKSHGGYTPLHIAAIHSQLNLIDPLVQYGANRNLRDNYGKKPYYYLPKEVPRELRQLLGDPKAINRELRQVRDDNDPQKHTISHLFQQPLLVGLKKKNKARVPFISVTEDAREDEPLPHKQRLSDVFH